LRRAAVPAGQRWDAALAALTGLLIIGAVAHEGAFASRDALIVTCGALVLGALRVVAGVPARVARVCLAFGALALWWYARAKVTGPGAQFLPLGASIVAFGAAFAIVAGTTGTVRLAAARGVVVLGSVSAALGLWAVAARWYPVAERGRGLWRLSSTLTYSNAAGLLLAMCLLVALGLRQEWRPGRLGVFLCASGLVACQSRGAAVAALIGMLLLPSLALLRAAWSLGLGLAVGALVVATSGGDSPRLWVLGIVGGAGVLVTLVDAKVDAGWTRPGRPRVVLAAGLIGGSALIALLLADGSIRHRLLVQDRSGEWSAALTAWRSAPWVGVGPDRPLLLNAATQTFAAFAHSEYLQILAGAGLVGALLLLGCGAALAAAIRRSDALAAAAVGALVAFAVAGAVDFDWHLPAIGLLGGWIGGLAVGRREGS
jgi:hypothetical protein